MTERVDQRRFYIISHSERGSFNREMLLTGSSIVQRLAELHALGLPFESEQRELAQLYTLSRNLHDFAESQGKVIEGQVKVRVTPNAADNKINHSLVQIYSELQSSGLDTFRQFSYVEQYYDHYLIERREARLMYVEDIDGQYIFRYSYNEIRHDGSEILPAQRRSRKIEQVLRSRRKIKMRRKHTART